MFPGFSLDYIDTGETVIRYRLGGSGPPLLLLHGHPQTHAMWGQVAPGLARHFTVVAADLRGYGGSAKPASTPDHATYSKRAMARDMVALMARLGFERFCLAGHDRGGRCAYRLALDHPDRVRALAVLDILPTSEHFRRADMAFALDWWHWFFLAQPADLPETLIGADPDYFYWRRHGPQPPSYSDPEAFADYRRAFTDPATIHAMCEDYRAGATIDFELDEADRQAGRKIACPVLVLWSKRETQYQGLDVRAIWQGWAAQPVQGQGLDCGHHIAEEAPEACEAALREFFSNR